MRDALAAMPGTDADAPRRPDRQVVDVGDHRGPRERQLGSRRDRGPTDYLDVVVCEDTRRDPAAAELPHVLTPSTADKLAVDLRVDPVAETPAHRRVGVLRSEHDRDIVEPGHGRGSDFDAHGWLPGAVRRRSDRATPPGSAASRPAP